MVNKSALEKALQDSWTKETSSDPDNWTHDNLAWGQCAVTALVVNDYFGGEIVWARALLPKGKTISHYFNKINGQEIDLTRRQFPEETTIPKGVPKTKGHSSTREYVLSFEATQKRYGLLRERVSKQLSL